MSEELKHFYSTNNFYDIYDTYFLRTIGGSSDIGNKSVWDMYVIRIFLNN